MVYLILTHSDTGDKTSRKMKLYSVPDGKRNAFSSETRDLAYFTMANDSIAEMMRAMTFFNERIFADAVNRNNANPQVLFSIDTINPPHP